MKNNTDGFAGATRHKHAPRSRALKARMCARLGRAEGQIRGVRRMVEGDTYCIDVLQQISAVRRALDRVALALVRDHLESCVAEAIRSRGGGADKIRELIETIDRFLA